MKNQMVKRFLKRAAAVSLAAVIAASAVTSGSLTAVAADEETQNVEEGSSADSGDTGSTEQGGEGSGDTGSTGQGGEDSGSQGSESTVTSEQVSEQLGTAEGAAGDVVASIPFGDVKEKEKEVIEAEKAADDSIKAAEDILKDAETQIDRETEADKASGNDKEGMLNKPAENENGETEIAQGSTEKNTGEANGNMDTAESTMNTAQGDFDAALADAQSKIDAGFTTSTEAQDVLNNLTQAQTDAQAEFDKAQGSMDAAKVNLDKAQADYDAAKKISDDAAKAAEEELNKAKAEMEKAVEAANTANERVKKVQNILGEASSYLESWKEDVEGAQQKVEEELEKSKDELHEAIDNLETESEEVKEAAEDFKEKFDEFTEATKDFNNSIKDAVDKQKKLDELYKQYEELKAAKDAAQKAYDDLGGDERKAELETQLKSLEEALAEAETALAEAEKTKDSYKIINEAEYVQNLQNQKDILSSEEKTQDEKDAAAKELADLVIKNELKGKGDGRTVVWVDKDGNGSDGKNIYGKPGDGLDGFYVVLEVQEDGTEKIVERYGYTVNTENGENKGTVDIHVMEGQNTTNFITIDGVNYPITVKEDKSMTITVGGEVIPVYKEGDEYYTKEAAEYRDDNVRPLNVTVPLGSAVVGKQNVNKDDEGYYYISGPAGLIKYRVEYIDGKWYQWNVTKTHKFELTVNSYETKPVITLNGETYDREGFEGNYYITKADGTKVNIFVDGNTYTYQNPVTFKDGGDENTTYGYAEAGYSSDTYYKVYQDYTEKKEEQERLAGEYDAVDKEYQKIVEKWNDLADAKDAFDEGDLNTLANLPRSVGDLIGKVEVDDIKNIADLIKQIDEVKNSSGLSQLKAIAELIKSAGNIGGILPEGIDVEELIINLTFEKDPGKLLDSKDKWSPAKHEYAVAWMDALKAKIDVVNKGKDLVDATNATIVSGIELIKAGADVNDALLDTMIAGVKTGILAGAAGSLVFAGDVLDVANKLVENLEGKVGELQAETQKAYDEAVKAQEQLLQLKLKNPKEDELNAAIKELDAAWAVIMNWKENWVMRKLP